MRKNKLETCIAAEARAKNNWSNSSKNLLGNKTLDNIIKDKDLLRDLSIFNNECL